MTVPAIGLLAVALPEVLAPRAHLQAFQSQCGGVLGWIGQP
jgi:hypothetical protein